MLSPAALLSIPMVILDLKPWWKLQAGSMESPEYQQAVTQLKYGPAESVLAATSLYPRFQPSETQVQIEVRAASLNPIDWQMIEGNRRLMLPEDSPLCPFSMSRASWWPPVQR